MQNLNGNALEVEKVILSVLVITYQHEKYVRKALDSVLMQKVSFGMEIIVSDDCSTDGTKEILREYQRNHVGRIRLLLHKTNIGATENSYRAVAGAKGKYIVFMDGDDYWTDVHKLEKQVKYLEEHPDRMGVFHKCHFVGEFDNKIHMVYEQMYHSRDPYTLAQFEEGSLPGHTATFMFRNVFRNGNGKYNFYYRIQNLVGDQTLYCMLLVQGDFGYIDEDMGAYRRIAKKGGTNVASLSVDNNLYGAMWKYFWNLEICVKSRLGAAVNLSVRRKNIFREACNRFRKTKSVSDFGIMVKIFLMDHLGTGIVNGVSAVAESRKQKNVERI